MPFRADFGSKFHGSSARYRVDFVTTDHNLKTVIVKASSVQDAVNKVRKRYSVRSISHAQQEG